MIVTGELNVDLGKEGGRVREEEITVAVETADLEDFSGHFLSRQRVWCRYRRTWATVQQGRLVRSRTDYIMGSDRRIIQNVAVWDPRHNSDHFMVMGCLRGASPREHYRYLGSRKRLPLLPPVRQTRTQADKIFSELQRAVPKSDKQTARHNTWISAETWRLVDERFSMQQEPGQD